MDALSKIRTYLQEKELDGIILTRRDNYCWATGGRRNHVLESTEIGIASLFITQDTIICIADNSDASRIEAEELPFPAQDVTISWFSSIEAEIFQLVEGKNVVSDTGMGGTKNVQSELVPLRMMLTAEEQQKYRRHGAQSAEILEGVALAVQPGQSEREIAATLAGKMAQQDIHASCILVGSDERVLQYRHPMPTDHEIKNSVMIVAGAEYEGLWVSLTRMVFFSSIPSEIANRYERTKQIFAAMQCRMQHNMLYSEYFSFVQELYAQHATPDEWEKHHQGGPTGYACREFVVCPSMEGALKKDQAYAWNPTNAGTKCEETTLLTENGVELLTKTSRWPRSQVETPWGVFSVAEIVVL